MHEKLINNKKKKGMINMKRITKKEIGEFLADVKSITKELRWEIWKIGAYNKYGKIHLYVAYHGQGINASVYNGDYDSIIDLAEYFNRWKNKMLDKEEVISIIQENINNRL